MGNILTPIFETPADPPAFSAAADNQWHPAAKSYRRVTDSLKGMNDAASPPTPLVVVKPANELGSRSTSSDPNILAQAKRLGLDASSSRDVAGNGFARPGAVTPSIPATGNILALAPPIPATLLPNGDSVNYGPAAAPLNPPGANIVSSRVPQLGDLERDMAAQSRATWGPVNPLSQEERWAADKYGNVLAERARIKAAAEAEAAKKLGVQ